MNAIEDGIEKYISLRQAFGYRFESQSVTLRQFAGFCSRNKRNHVTVKTLLDWIDQSPNASLKSMANRVSIVRSFASYWTAFDSKTEIPPRNLNRDTKRRFQPYVYSQTELKKILTACRKFNAERGRSNPIRRLTFETMFGLIASMGLRRSEAINLKVADVNLVEGRIRIELTKFGKSRLLPVHPTVIRQLHLYVQVREKNFPNPKHKNFFLMNRGQPVDDDSIYYAFVHACQIAGIRQAREGNGPRIHDLRHTFAVRAILNCLKRGEDVHVMMPALSAYMGHAQPTDTYLYLTGVPELMRFGLREAHR